MCAFIYYVNITMNFNALNIFCCDLFFRLRKCQVLFAIVICPVKFINFTLSTSIHAAFRNILLFVDK